MDLELLIMQAFASAIRFFFVGAIAAEWRFYYLLAREYGKLGTY
jgi:hypothetical protein